MLRWRLLSATVIVAGLGLLMWLDVTRPLAGVVGLWLLPALLAVAVLGTEEVLHLLRGQGYRPSAWASYVGSLLVTLSACGPLWRDLLGKRALPEAQWPLVALAAAMLLIYLVEMRRFERPGAAIVSAALATWTVVYIGGMLAFLALLRLEFGSVWGLAALISVPWVVKLSDTGAYAVGKNWGRHQLTPILSPGKTVEGAIGGVLAACLASWIYFRLLLPAVLVSAEPPASHLAALAYGLALALTGILGDLAESLLKRDMQRKDSSTWLPGLGGVLDIVDSILLSAPAAYLCWTLGLVGPR